MWYGVCGIGYVVCDMGHVALGMWYGIYMGDGVLIEIRLKSECTLQNKKAKMCFLKVKLSSDNPTIHLCL